MFDCLGTNSCSLNIVLAFAIGFSNAIIPITTFLVLTSCLATFPSSKGPIHILIPRAIDGQHVDVGATRKLKHEEQAVVCDEDMDLDVESLQGPGDIFNPKPIDEPMHDAHAGTGLGEGVDTQFVQE